MLELSNSLQFDAVIAEGVETADQRDTLVGLGYRLGQGFLFGAPADAGQTAVRLSEAFPAAWPLRSSAPGPSMSCPSRDSLRGRLV